MNATKSIHSLRQNFLLLLVVCIFATTTDMYGQLQQFTLQGREYRLEAGKWYTFFEGRKGDEIIPHRLIVRLKDKGFLENFDFQRLNISGVSFGSARFLDGFYVLTIAPDRDAFQIASTLQASGRFDVLEFDAIGKRHRTPSDPWYFQQWNLPKIQMPQAWNITTGSSSIILGVIDSGTRYTHEDLDGNIWVMNSDGSNPQQLTTEGAAEFWWSPEGRRIAYVSHLSLYTHASGCGLGKRSEPSPVGSRGHKPCGDNHNCAILLDFIPLSYILTHKGFLGGCVFVCCRSQLNRPSAVL